MIFSKPTEIYRTLLNSSVKCSNISTKFVILRSSISICLVDKNENIFSKDFPTKAVLSIFSSSSETGNPYISTVLEMANPKLVNMVITLFFSVSGVTVTLVI